MRLGVFDSGIGGEAVAASLQQAFPDAGIITVNDHNNVPYGSKSIKEIITLTDAAIQPLLKVECDVIILACNTATAAAIETLRQHYPEQAFIGLEPMVKPAAGLTKTGVIAVCATPFTLTSERYKNLLNRYAKNLKVIEPDCSNWASMIEHNAINQKIIDDVVKSCCEQGADVIVLACTHYHWIKNMITEAAKGRAIILEPSEAIANRVSAIVSLKSQHPLLK